MVERVRDDPWKIVVATTLLNRTTGRAVRPVFWELVKLYPTPVALAQGQPIPSLLTKSVHLMNLW